MDDKSFGQIQGRCVICNTYGPVKEGPNGKDYCSIHLKIKLEENINKRKWRVADKWREWFQSVINTDPETNPSQPFD